MLRRNKEEQEPSHDPAGSQERLALPLVVSELPPEVGVVLCIQPCPDSLVGAAPSQGLGGWCRAEICWSLSL